MSVAYVLVMLLGSIITGVLAGSRVGMGAVAYPGYYALSVIARILFVIAHISFVLTMTIYTRNAIIGFAFGLVIPNIPKIVEMILGFLKSLLTSILSKSLHICRLFIRHLMTCAHSCHVSLCCAYILFWLFLLVLEF